MQFHSIGIPVWGDPPGLGVLKIREIGQGVNVSTALTLGNRQSVLLRDQPKTGAGRGFHGRWSSRTDEKGKKHESIGRRRGGTSGWFFSASFAAFLSILCGKKLLAAAKSF